MEENCAGSPLFSRDSTQLGSERKSELDAAVTDVSTSASRWANISIPERISLLDRMLSDCSLLAPEWLDASARGKGVLDNPDAVGQEWISGPYVTLRYLRRLRNSLHQIETKGTVELPRVYRQPSNGRTIVRALPQDIYDRIFFSGVSADVMMVSGIAPDDISTHVALTYLGNTPHPGTTLVLGAGNVSGMGPIDSLYELFLGNRTVLLKMSPVNSYMSEIIERSFCALIKEGVLRIVKGGNAEGSYLCDQSGISGIRLTGSDKTYEAVVYGSNASAAERKAHGVPLRTKPVSAELGGVGPAIVIPGRWTEREIIQGAELIATTAFDGGGFSCGATDLVILPDMWPQKNSFLDALRSVLSRMPLRPAYYPGTHERFSAFVSGHSKVEFFGQPAEGQLPWAFIRDLDMDNTSEMCFSCEPFCGVFADMAIRTGDLGSYLRQVVNFLNDRVWGTLGVMLLVPSSLAGDIQMTQQVERSITDLRYGTVAVNYHPSANWVSGVTPWGGYQGMNISPSESGVGFSQNALMLADTEKTVIRAPLGGPFPPPVWLVGRGQAACKTFARLCRFEGNPSFTHVPSIVKSGIGW